MPEFQFKNGKTLAFEEFPIKEGNLRKINIYHSGADCEGLWAAFSDEGVKDYDSHKNSHEEYQGVCVLQNDALHFYPTASWGLYVPVKWKGGVRPVLDLADMAGSFIWCKERRDLEAKEKAKETK